MTITDNQRTTMIYFAIEKGDEDQIINELNNIENEFSRLTINVNDSEFTNFINH